MKPEGQRRVSSALSAAGARGRGPRTGERSGSLRAWGMSKLESASFPPWGRLSSPLPALATRLDSTNDKAHFGLTNRRTQLSKNN